MLFPDKTPFILDGSTGTMLYEAGMPSGACTEAWALEHPQAVAELQRAYAGAGAMAVMAPTFGANAPALGRHGFDGRVSELNRRLVQMSRESVPEHVLVAGDMSPLGLFTVPFGDETFESLYNIYLEQAEALEEAGVDYFALETFMSVPEARAAVCAIRAVSKKPITCTFTCEKNGRTMTGSDALAAMLIMEGMGVSAFGLNCSAGPADMVDTFSRLSAFANVPLIAKPNAGLPVIENGKTSFVMTPLEMAAFIPRFAELGVTVFGGCCGTSPAHIKAIADAAREISFMAGAAKEKRSFYTAANEKNAVFIDPSDISMNTINCSPALADDIMDAEEDGALLRLRLNKPEDISILEESQYLIRGALCLSADEPALLQNALKIYHGRALAERSAGIDERILAELSARYGLILI